MKHIRYIELCILSVRRTVCVLSALAVFGLGFSQDFTRLSERSLFGTARYVGMSGAMTAIGGDPSAVQDNPAGLGLYRRAEIMITMGFNAYKMRQLTTTNDAARSYFTLPQVSGVVSMPTANCFTQQSGVQFHNFMFSYNRLHSFNRTFLIGVANTNSLGSLLADKTTVMDIPFCAEDRNNSHSFRLYESGYVDQYAFNWAMNANDKWYFGLGLQIQSYLLSSDGNYFETFDVQNADGVSYSNRNRSSLILSGVGTTLSAGFIYRPLRFLRMGLGFQTASLGSLRGSTTGTFSAQTDSLRHSYAPDMSFSDKNFHMPWKLSASMAFQISAYAMIALQYNFTGSRDMQPFHSFRLGFEVIPVMGMYINAGMAFESTCTNYAQPEPMDYSFDRQDTYSLYSHNSWLGSIAVGYRGAHMIFQLAYQYNRQDPFLFAHEYTPKYDNLVTDTHRLVFSIGWHQN